MSVRMSLRTSELRGGVRGVGVAAPARARGLGLRSTQPGIFASSATAVRRATSTSATADSSPRTFPAIIPTPQVLEITEPAALDMLAAYRTTPVAVPGYPEPVETAFIGPGFGGGAAEPLAGAAAAPPVLLLHGFDSSAVEWRRTFPKLAEKVETYAIDLLGWGYSDVSMFERDQALPLGPKQIREHLYQFWKQEIGRPMVLAGASLGGTMAMDFALEYPEAVAKLVLVDAQGYIDGIGPAAKGPRFVARLGAALLRTQPLRESANRMAYHDTARFATRDAMLIGRLHTHCLGWIDSKVAFIKSGGYQGIAARIPDVTQPALLLWGAQDGILDPKYAQEFERDLRDVEVVMFDKCGHVPHLEQSERCAEAILRFATADVEAGVAA